MKTLGQLWHLNGMQHESPLKSLRTPPEPAPPPVKEPPGEPEDPHAPLQEPDPDPVGPAQI